LFNITVISHCDYFIIIIVIYYYLLFIIIIIIITVVVVVVIIIIIRYLSLLLLCVIIRLRYSLSILSSPVYHFSSVVVSFNAYIIIIIYYNR